MANVEIKTEQDRARAYYERLMVTARFFAEHRTVTAATKALGLTKVSLFAHLRKLRDLGYAVDEAPVREGKRGPMAIAYKVREPPKHG